MKDVQEEHNKMLEYDRKHIDGLTHMHANDFGKDRHSHSRMKICVSGAASTGHCGLDAYEVAKQVGREIVRQGAIITTGATTGFPMYAAIGAKEEGGFSIGFSPAETELEHLDQWKLPVDYMDIIIYTGFGFPGRDLILTKSSDAIVIGCGRVGTIHEFTVAYEEHKPIGILEGAWETDEVLRHLMGASNRPMDNVVIDSDPKILVEKLIEMITANDMALSKKYNHLTAITPEDIIAS